MECRQGVCKKSDTHQNICNNGKNYHKNVIHNLKGEEMPTKWREHMILDFLKPNKDASDFKNYRPITLK